QPVSIHLGLNISLNTGRCAIFRNGEWLPLTSQEFVILKRLIETPCCYVCTAILVNLLSKPGKIEVSSHSIEQIIYGLRKKLGCNQKGSQIILNRRNIGYGIFLDEEAGSQ